ncbi:MAG: ribbon-helix-helix protein, CopG family [Dehalococcoidia bacterium]|nr:ribbon-helix-helix protein, CopG family [Dehalococcoidia bacterium]
MARTTKTVTISLSAEMVNLIHELRQEEGRTTSELIREAVRLYAEEREWNRVFRYGQIKAAETDIQADQVEEIVDTYRK